MFNQFRPDNFVDYLGNPLFHSEDKGCEIETIENFSMNNGTKGQSVNHETHCVNQMCHTHNVLCSKTGWELHYYQGNKSESKKGGTCVCKRCGKQWSGLEAHYCSKCKRINKFLYLEANNIPMGTVLSKNWKEIKRLESL